MIQRQIDQINNIKEMPTERVLLLEDRDQLTHLRDKLAAKLEDFDLHVDERMRLQKD